MSFRKMSGLLLLSTTLLISSMIVMFSVLSHYIDQNTPSSHINWFEYIPTIVYVLLFIPLGISLYLVFYRNKKDEKIN